MAHFLLGETEKASDYAKKALDKNPANTEAYAILVQISTDEETLEEIIAKVPGHLRETSQIANAISEIAKQRGNFEEAKKWGEIMVEYEQEDISGCKATLATILIQQVLHNRQESDFHSADLPDQLEKSEKEQLRQAIELLTEAWACVANTELAEFRTDWIINRSTAHLLLGETKEAKKNLDRAIELEPTYSNSLKNRAILAFGEGEYKSAIEFLNKIQSGPETSEIPILIANILLAGGHFDEVIKKLNDFLMTAPEAPLREEANRLLIKVHVAREDFDKAQEISTAMRESSPTSVLNLVDAARIAKANGKSDEMSSLLEKACGFAQNSSAFLEIMELANELYINEEFKRAATLYEKIADTHINSQWTRRLLESYYQSGERKRRSKFVDPFVRNTGQLKR